MKNAKPTAPRSTAKAQAARPPKRQPREDMNQIAYRVMQETIRRSEGK